MKHCLALLTLVVTLASCSGSVACVTARHVAVGADDAFAQSVFAVDDAELAACQQGALTPAQCAVANEKIKAALLDVKAVTQALIDTPTSVAVPKDLPALLANLTAVQTIVGDLGAGPVKQDLVTKITDAIDRAIAVLGQFTGGKGQ